MEDEMGIGILED